MTISGQRKLCNDVEPMQKTKFTLDFSDSLTRAEEFVAEISQVASDINAKYGTREVDAKALIGFLNMSHLPVQIIINPNNDEDLKRVNEICKKYEVKSYVK